MSRPLSRTLPELCEENATFFPEFDAVIDDHGRRLTYSGLHSDALSFGRGLRNLGVSLRDTVALLAPNSAEWIVSAVGAHSAGAKVAAFHTWVKAHDLDFLLAHSEATTLIVAARVGAQSLLDPLQALLPEIWEGDVDQWKSPRYPSLQRVVVLGDEPPSGARGWSSVLTAASSGAGSVGPGPNGDDIAFILYTSGSTADPKGVPLLHSDMITNGFHIGQRMGLHNSDRVWLGSPLFWSFGSANAMIAAFTHGAALVVQEKFDASTAAAQISEERCTAAYLLPALAHAFAKVPDIKHRLVTLRTGLTIGRADEVKAIAVGLGVAEICNVYGSTETYGNCCVTAHDMPLAKRIRCQGPPLPGMEVRIVDADTRHVVPVGAEGAVEVRGRITPGYWKAPEINIMTFTDEGWYRTGDIGRLDEEGCFTFVTRDSDMIKTNGINVSPSEVEAFILSDPAIEEVVVVGAPDSERDQVVVAFVRLAEGASIEADEIIGRCRRELAGYKVPRQVWIVDAMPQTATGKLSRKQLRAMLALGNDPFRSAPGAASTPGDGR